MTHVQHGAVSFGGVAQPLSDPTNGELIAWSELEILNNHVAVRRTELS